MKLEDDVLWGSAGLMLGLILLRLRRGKFPIYDVIGEARLSSKAAPHTRKRDPVRVNAAVLHQMAFSRGNDYRRYLRVTAHYIILPDGSIYQLHPHSTRLPAANGFNSNSVSIEFAGNFPSKSRSRDPDDWWYPDGREGSSSYQNQVTAAQVSSGRSLLRKLQDDGVTIVLAHRQSSGDRGNDPGPDLWGGVGEYGVRELGMSDGGEDFAIDSGKPIKQSWRDAYDTWRYAA